MQHKLQKSCYYFRDFILNITYALFRTTLIVHYVVVFIKDDSENLNFPFFFEKSKIIYFQNDKSFNFHFHISVIQSTKVSKYEQINTYLRI